MLVSQSVHSRLVNLAVLERSGCGRRPLYNTSSDAIILARALLAVDHEAEVVAVLECLRYRFVDRKSVEPGLVGRSACRADATGGISGARQSHLILINRKHFRWLLHGLLAHSQHRKRDGTRHGLPLEHRRSDHRFGRIDPLPCLLRYG